MCVVPQASGWILQVPQVPQSQSAQSRGPVIGVPWPQPLLFSILNSENQGELEESPFLFGLAPQAAQTLEGSHCIFHEVDPGVLCSLLTSLFWCHKMVTDFGVMQKLVLFPTEPFSKQQFICFIWHSVLVTYLLYRFGSENRIFKNIPKEPGVLPRSTVHDNFIPSTWGRFLLQETDSHHIHTLKLCELNSPHLAREREPKLTVMPASLLSEHVPQNEYEMESINLLNSQSLSRIPRALSPSVLRVIQEYFGLCFAFRVYLHLRCYRILRFYRVRIKRMGVGVRTMFTRRQGDLGKWLTLSHLLTVNNY